MTTNLALIALIAPIGPNPLGKALFSAFPSGSYLLGAIGAIGADFAGNIFGTLINRITGSDSGEPRSHGGELILATAPCARASCLLRLRTLAFKLNSPRFSIALHNSVVVLALVRSMVYWILRQKIVSNFSAGAIS